MLNGPILFRIRSFKQEIWLFLMQAIVHKNYSKNCMMNKEKIIRNGLADGLMIINNLYHQWATEEISEESLNLSILLFYQSIPNLSYWSKSWPWVKSIITTDLWLLVWFLYLSVLNSWVKSLLIINTGGSFTPKTQRLSSRKSKLRICSSAMTQESPSRPYSFWLLIKNLQHRCNHYSYNSQSNFSKIR